MAASTLIKKIRLVPELSDGVSVSMVSRVTVITAFRVKVGIFMRDTVLVRIMLRAKDTGGGA